MFPDDYTRFFEDYKTECTFVILMATNIWQILEEDFYSDYLLSYARLIYTGVPSLGYFMIDADKFCQSLFKKEYVRNITEYPKEPSISLTLSGAWTVYKLLNNISPKLEEDFYVIHERIRTHPYLMEKEADDLKMYNGKFEGKYIQVGL